MEDITLYDAPNSPCGRRVRMCLIEKGISFEIRWLSLGLMDQKQDWYLQLNPNGLVPTLIHDGNAVYESNVINEYVDALHPEPRLVPTAPHLQAQMRMWMAFELDWAKPFRDAIYETMGKKRLQDTNIGTDELAKEISEER
jgi:glutathione S-transferase